MADEPGFAAVRIARAWDEATGLRGLELDLGNTGFAPSFTKPGQYVRARRAAGEKDAFLALASTPGSPRFELLLQRTGAEPPKPVDLLFAKQAGESIEITAAAGKGYPIEGERGRDLLLFAGGSGISAIRSLVEHIAAHRADFGRVALLYGAREPGDFAYASHVERWRASTIDVVLVLSKTAPSGWKGRTGYAQAMLPELAVDPAKTSAFVTGGKAFDAGVSEALGKLGIARIFRNF